MTLATLTLKLAHLSGQELNRAGDMGSGHWSPPPPAYMSNGLTYGPIYLETGSRFKVQLSYTMSSEFDVVVGDNLFDIELLNKADTSYTPPSDSHIYSAGYGVFIQFKAIPANQGVRYQSDRTPDGFELTLTYQENEAVSMNEPPIRGGGLKVGRVVARSRRRCSLNRAKTGSLGSPPPRRCCCFARSRSARPAAASRPLGVWRRFKL